MFGPPYVWVQVVRARAEAVNGMERPARGVFRAAPRACPSAPAGVTPPSAVGRAPVSSPMSGEGWRVDGGAGLPAEGGRDGGAWRWERVHQSPNDQDLDPGIDSRHTGNHGSVMCIDDGVRGIHRSKVRLRLPDAVVHHLVPSSSLQARFAFLVNVNPPLSSRSPSPRRPLESHHSHGPDHVQIDVHTSLRGDAASTRGADGARGERGFQRRMRVGTGGGVPLLSVGTVEANAIREGRLVCPRMHDVQLDIHGQGEGSNDDEPKCR
ncbi:hypothetical protein BJ912DRAFT_936042 [Pholiota molesta]|nr:hypothetical protein BJ912DRAFT_936042 [Pholiota molesta]